MTESRRGFLRICGSVAASAALGSSLLGRDEIPYGVQLYCVRHELEQDMEGTLARLARAGFVGVEFADYFGRSAEQLRALLDQNGLRCCGTHIMLDDMLGDRLQETIEFNRTLGNRYLIVRWLSEERRKDRVSFLETARLLNQIAEKLEPHGMQVGYHNHDYIFETFDGKMLWNILADETESRVVLQLDTGNASSRADVIELLRRNRGRTHTIHIKPYSTSDPDAFVGDDELDWETIVRLCQSLAGTEWYIIEYEVEGHPPLEALEANLERFKKIVASV